MGAPAGAACFGSGLLKEKKASFSFSGLRHPGLRKAEREGFPCQRPSISADDSITWAPSTKTTPQPSLEVTLSMASGFMRRFS